MAYIDYYLPDIGRIADWVSLLSLAVSAYAAFGIFKVRTQIVSRVRLPVLLGILEKHGEEIARLMLTYDDVATRERLIVEFTMCEANLRLVKPKVSRAVARRAKSLMSEISVYKRARWFGYYPAQTTRDQAWNIYADLNGMIQEVTNMVEENRMGA